ncbi:MAG: DUF4199 domain-containing protein [Cyclobacteriaceae bacterium]|nr:DUF4199 domain-containing protein [Cyclobacteriaceae bacterium HetDA_MAG_MS6]
MIKVSAKYALACGIFLILLFQVTRFFGANPLIDLSHLVFDAILIAIFSAIALRELKVDQGGVLHFWQGMTVSFLIYLPGAIVFSLGLICYFLIDIDFMESYKEQAMIFLESSKATYVEQFGEEKYMARLESVEDIKFSNLWVNATVKKLIVGLFVSPMISVILRRKPN